MAWLAHALAARGFIVAAVDHNGTADEELHAELTPSDYFSWERPRDLTAVLDRLLDDPMFGPAIDRRRIGAAGFSLGGTTAIWLGGARLDLDRLQRMAPPPPPFLASAIERLKKLPLANAAARQSLQRADRSYRDPRIRSIFALAPAIGFGFTEDGLRRINVPVQIVVGDADVINPPADNARRFAERIATARYLELPGERGHFTGATTPERQHAELEEVAELAVRFFEASLDLADPRAALSLPQGSLLSSSQHP